MSSNKNGDNAQEQENWKTPKKEKLSTTTTNSIIYCEQGKMQQAYRPRSPQTLG